MPNFVSIRQLSPLSIFITLCGFYTIDCRKEKFRQTTQAYCWVVSAFYFVACAVFLFHWSFSLEKLTEISVIFVLPDTAGLVTFTYYRVKHDNRDNVYNGNFENLDDVDENLESVAHLGEQNLYLQSEYKVYTMITISSLIYVAYKHYCVFSVSKCRNNKICEIQTTYASIIRLSLHVFTVLLALRFLYVLFRIYISIFGVRHVIQSIKKLGATRVAWVSQASVPGTAYRVENRQRSLRKFFLAFACIGDGFSTANSLYKYLVLFQLIRPLF